MKPPRALAGAAWESRLLGVIAATLVVFGIAAVYGASSIWAVQNDLPGGTYAWRQLFGAVVGIGLLLVGARVDYHRWSEWAWPLLGVTAFALVLLLLPFTRGIAPELNGARRWLVLGPLTVQPSEAAKLAVVVWAAMLAAKKGGRVREFRLGVLPFLVTLGPFAMLIVAEPDLSTTVVTLLLAGIVLFAAGARIGHFLLLGVLAIPLLWHEIVSVQYRLTRMVSFLGAGEDVAQAGWQIDQSLIGIGAGGLLGVGFGEGMQKLGYLPYAYSDFIFSTIGEEWGFLGVLVVVALFALYVGLGFRIARLAPDTFGVLLAVGLTAMIGVAACLHVAVSLALVPTSGISLPFLSYGRSSLLVSLFATGVLMNIGAQQQVPARGSR